MVMRNFNQYAPKGIDEKLKIVQDVIAGHIGWSDIDIYGRVIRIQSPKSKLIVPHVQISELETAALSIDDNVSPSGVAFFIDEEKHAPKGGKMVEADVKIVFMLNLKNIFPTTVVRPDMLAEDKALKLIKRIGAVRNLGIEKGVTTILKGFNYKAYQQFDIAPYYTFAITGKINYNN